MMYRGQELDEKLVEQLRERHRKAQAWIAKNYARATHNEVAEHKNVIDEIGPLLKKWDAPRRKP